MDLPLSTIFLQKQTLLSDYLKLIPIKSINYSFYDVNYEQKKSLCKSIKGHHMRLQHN